MSRYDKMNPPIPIHAQFPCMIRHELLQQRPEPITGGNRLAAHIASSLEACKPLMSVSLSDQNVAVGTHKSHTDSLIYLR